MPLQNEFEIGSRLRTTDKRLRCSMLISLLYVEDDYAYESGRPRSLARQNGGERHSQLCGDLLRHDVTVTSATLSPFSVCSPR